MLDTCVPYSKKACLDAGKSLGLNLGSAHFPFVGDYSEVGCFSKGGSVKGSVFYGTGGSIHEMKQNVSGGKFRPKGYDCLTTGRSYYIFNISFTINVIKVLCSDGLIYSFLMFIYSRCMQDKRRPCVCVSFYIQRNNI